VEVFNQKDLEITKAIERLRKELSIAGGKRSDTYYDFKQSDDARMRLDAMATATAKKNRRLWDYTEPPKPEPKPEQKPDKNMVVIDGIRMTRKEYEELKDPFRIREDSKNEPIGDRDYAKVMKTL
jgi:hypothetical protein